MKKIFSEFLGTFFLVFAGTGAIVINQHTGGAITHVGIALVFGLVVMAMIYTFGDVSGAHLNPAVRWDSGSPGDSRGVRFQAMCWRNSPGHSPPVGC